MFLVIAQNKWLLDGILRRNRRPSYNSTLAHLINMLETERNNKITTTPISLMKMLVCVISIADGVA
jgi:hypothetical protein